ncbi:hypothetical protein PS1_036531 [Malus domestica]
MVAQSSNYPQTHLKLHRQTRRRWKTQPRRSFLHGGGLAPPEPPQNPCLRSRDNLWLLRAYPRPSMHSLEGSTGRSSLEVYWEDKGGGGFKRNGEGKGKGRQVKIKRLLVEEEDDPHGQQGGSKRYDRFLHDCVSDIFAQCLKAEYKREQLAAANEIDPDDAVLLPHDILSYIKYPELEQEADVKWKKMFEVYSKQGKLKNGKGGRLHKNPWRHSIQDDDLNSRAKYMQTLIKSQDWTADFGKVFDVILEEAVNANLKPDKMVKKVLA